MSSPADFRPLEIRLAPEYRRCAIYVAIGYVVLVATVVALKLAGIDNRSWSNAIACFAISALGVLFLFALTYRYRIRIDDRGVRRRRFVRWDLWPWEAFEEGKVCDGKLGDQLVFPVKSWYWRSIAASFFSERDRTAYETIVRRYRVVPPPPEVPESLSLKYDLGKSLELSAAGVRVAPWPTDDLIGWRDVIRVEVVRSSHDRTDFTILELHLPGSEKQIRLKRQHLSKRGNPEPEVLALFLEQHLADDRFQVTAMRGEPIDDAEADRRLARLAERERDFRKTNRVSWWMHLGFLLFMSILIFGFGKNGPPWNWGRADWLEAAIVFGVLMLALGAHHLLLYGVLFFGRREVRRDRAAILKWKAILTPVP